MLTRSGGVEENNYALCTMCIYQKVIIANILITNQCQRPDVGHVGRSFRSSCSSASFKSFPLNRFHFNEAAMVISRKLFRRT